MEYSIDIESEDLDLLKRIGEVRKDDGKEGDVQKMIRTIIRKFISDERSNYEDEFNNKE